MRSSETSLGRVAIQSHSHASWSGHVSLQLITTAHLWRSLRFYGWTAIISLLWGNPQSQLALRFSLSVASCYPDALPTHLHPSPSSCDIRSSGADINHRGDRGAERRAAIVLSPRPCCHVFRRRTIDWWTHPVWLLLSESAHFPTWHKYFVQRIIEDAH